MTPKKYLQSLHTPKKYSFFSKPVKNIEIQNFEPKNLVRRYVCVKISDYPPGSKTCLIIVTDVNMTSKRAFLQKVTVLLNSTTEKGVYLNKLIVFGVFMSQRSLWIMPSAKRK